MIDMSCWYWQLDDGRIWSTADASYVPQSDTVTTWLAAQGLSSIPLSPVDTTGAHSEDGVREALAFYGLPLGALQAWEDVVAVKLAAIQTEKCRVRDAGFSVDGVHYDSDQAARLAYMEFALAVAQDSSYTQEAWKASESVWVSMDATLFASVKAAGAAAIKAAFDWQRARDAEVAAIQAAVAAGTMTETDARTALAAVSTSYTTEVAA